MNAQWLNETIVSTSLIGTQQITLISLIEQDENWPVVA